MTIHFDPVHPDQLDLLRAISGQLASMERRIEEADRRQMEAEQRQMLILQKLQEMPSPPSIPPTCTCISNDKVASIINNLSSDQPPTLSPASSILPSPFSPPSSPYPFYQVSIPALPQPRLSHYEEHPGPSHHRQPAYHHHQTMPYQYQPSSSISTSVRLIGKRWASSLACWKATPRYIHVEAHKQSSCHIKK